MGKPGRSTSIGCEGLHAVDGRNILIRAIPGFCESHGGRLEDGRG